VRARCRRLPSTYEFPSYTSGLTGVGWIDAPFVNDEVLTLDVEGETHELTPYPVASRFLTPDVELSAAHASPRAAECSVYFSASP